MYTCTTLCCALVRLWLFAYVNFRHELYVQAQIPSEICFLQSRKGFRDDFFQTV